VNEIMETIKIDQLEQTKNTPNNFLVSAKRKINERSGVHAWHPYYAGYSESFVRSAISYLKLTPGSLILDPWNGSGTTGLVAGRQKMTSIGFDINPVMTHFAMAKTSSVVSFRNEIPEIVDAVLSDAKLLCKKGGVGREFLQDWMSDVLLDSVSGIQTAIETAKLPEIKTESMLTDALKSGGKIENPLRSFLLAGLFITSRNLAGYTKGSNPTWTRAAKEMKEYKRKQVFDAYKSQVLKMLVDLEEIRIPEGRTLKNAALVADSRWLPLKSNSVDAIITSPPYLTRIDYAISTKPELLLLGDPAYLRSIRELTMGAPVIVEGDIIADDTWGKLCLDLLDAVEGHSSKSAKNYYLPNMLQYFRDAELSLIQILRTLHRKSSALLVVQSSYFKEFEIDLGNIYVQMATNLGAQAKIVRREKVRGHMAHVNTKSRQYADSKVFFEDVVEIKKIDNG